MRFILALVSWLAICLNTSCKTPEQNENSSVKAIDDVQSMVLESNGLFTVTCRDGSAENQVFLGEVKTDQVCKKKKIQNVFFQDFALNPSAEPVALGAPWTRVNGNMVLVRRQTKTVKGSLFVRDGVLQFDKAAGTAFRHDSASTMSQDTLGEVVFETQKSPTRASVITEFSYAKGGAYGGGTTMSIHYNALPVNVRLDETYDLLLSKVECRITKSADPRRSATLEILTKRLGKSSNRLNMWAQMSTLQETNLAVATIDNAELGKPHTFGCMKDGDIYTAFFDGIKIAAQAPALDDTVAESMAFGLQERVDGGWCSLPGNNQSVLTCQRIQKLKINVE